METKPPQLIKQNQPNIADNPSQSGNKTENIETKNNPSKNNEEKIETKKKREIRMKPGKMTDL